MVSLEEYKDPDLKVKAFEDSVGSKVDEWNTF